MTRSLDFDRAMRARFQNGVSADRFMTRTRLLIREINNQKDRPMTDEMREELRKLIACLNEAFGCLFEDDTRLERALRPVAERTRQIQTMASVFVLASDGEMNTADVNYQERKLRRSAAQ